MINVSEIIERHRDECELLRKLVDEAMRNCDIETMAFAKVASETFSIIHELECKTYNIDGATIDLVQRALFARAKRLAG